MKYYVLDSRCGHVCDNSPKSRFLVAEKIILPLTRSKHIIGSQSTLDNSVLFIMPSEVTLEDSHLIVAPCAFLNKDDFFGTAIIHCKLFVIIYGGYQGITREF